jgi:eukaryotic-like serine/threonine-protein kinase
MDPPDEKRDQTDSEQRRQRPDMIGRVLSERYRIDAVIASGAFGSVYRGAHLHMHKQVAIKILHPEVENFPELVERFEREAVAGAHISHPNVAVASDLGKFDGDSYFLVQEYVPGETLRDVMQRGPMPAERAAYIARQIAEALAAAHRHKIVHRDLKPTNIMIVEGSNDFVKLIDFGFARVPVEDLPHMPQGDQGPQWEMSQAGVVFGSVSYMAPDAFLGMRNVDERSDLYALGLIFYEMLAGQHPFDVNLPPAALFELQRNRLPPPLRDKNADCDASEDLEWVIMRLLAKTPEERYQEASAVVAAIDGAMQGIQGFMQRRESHRPPAGLPARSVALAVERARAPTPAIRRSPRIERSWLAGGAIALLGLGAAVGLFALRSGSDPEQSPAPPASEQAPASAPTPAPIAPSAARAEPATDARPPESSRRDPRREFLELADQAPPEAAKAWLRLVRADDKALEDGQIQAKTAALLSRADLREEATTKVFEELAFGTGELGLDVLYRIVEEDPTSSAAQRALPLLYKHAVSGRGSPALLVTLDIRRMNCSRKIRQFDRAAKHGDERTLRELEKLHPPSCVVRKGACCFKDDPKLESSLAQIRDRVPPKDD